MVARGRLNNAYPGNTNSQASEGNGQAQNLPPLLPGKALVEQG